MNKQFNPKTGRRGIEWCDYTWNSIGGCRHRCRWMMPDGSIAICYAEAVANRVAQQAYPEGFEHHYWRPNMLNEPFLLKEPARIFLDSMADLMGNWVPSDQIHQVLDICWRASQHTFLLLTKNAPRLSAFKFPANVHIGISSPPDFMFGRALNRMQQYRMLERAFNILSRLTEVPVCWMSFEPLSQDYSQIVADHPGVLQWSVIGAASNGRTYYQPDPDHVSRLLDVLDRQGVPVFFKGNLDWSPWREELPAVENNECY